MGTLPLSLIGSFWLMYWLGFNFSIAVGVGMIALAGVAVETGVIMLVYLNQAWQEQRDKKISSSKALSKEALFDAVLTGASVRVRPVLMTASATIIGLIPIMLGSGTGSEVMSRLAAPMVGGMVSAVILTLLVLPVVFYLWKRSPLSEKLP